MIKIKGRSVDSIMHELNHNIVTQDLGPVFRQAAYEFTVEMADPHAILTKGSSLEYLDEFGEFVSKTLLLLF